MAISIRCPQCQKEYTLDDSLAGKRAKCKQCGAVVQLPGVARDAPAVSGAGKPSGAMPTAVREHSQSAEKPTRALAKPSQGSTNADDEYALQSVETRAQARDDLSMANGARSASSPSSASFPSGSRDSSSSAAKSTGAGNTCEEGSTSAKLSTWKIGTIAGLVLVVLGLGAYAAFEIFDEEDTAQEMPAYPGTPPVAMPGGGMPSAGMPGMLPGMMPPLGQAGPHGNAQAPFSTGPKVSNANMLAPKDPVFVLHGRIWLAAEVLRVLPSGEVEVQIHGQPSPVMMTLDNMRFPPGYMPTR